MIVAVFVLLLAAVLAANGARYVREEVWVVPRTCEACAYSMVGLPDGSVCPECGGAEARGHAVWKGRWEWRPRGIVVGARLASVALVIPLLAPMAWWWHNTPFCGTGARFAGRLFASPEAAWQTVRAYAAIALTPVVALAWVTAFHLRCGRFGAACAAYVAYPIAALAALAAGAEAEDWRDAWGGVAGVAVASMFVLGPALALTRAQRAKPPNREPTVGPRPNVAHADPADE